jgi:hypothetical protein
VKFAVDGHVIDQGAHDIHSRHEVDRHGRREDGQTLEWHEGQRPPTPPIRQAPAPSEILVLRHGHPLHWAVKQGFAPSPRSTFDARPEPPSPRRVNWGDTHEGLKLETAQEVRGDENPPPAFMKQEIEDGPADELGAQAARETPDRRDMGQYEASGKPAARLRLQLNEGLGFAREENYAPAGQRQVRGTLEGYTPVAPASLQILADMRDWERGRTYGTSGRAYEEGERAVSGRTNIPPSAGTGSSLPPRPNMGNFKPIHFDLRGGAGAMSRRGRRSPSPAAVGSRRSPSPFRADSPTRSRNGSVGGMSNASTRSKMDMLRFQTYDGQLRQPTSAAGSEDMGSIFVNPVQVYKTSRYSRM